MSEEPKTRGGLYIVFTIVACVLIVVASQLFPPKMKRSKADYSPGEHVKLVTGKKSAVRKKDSTVTDPEPKFEPDLVTPYFSRLLEDYRTAQRGRTRNDVVIRYYRKQADENKIDSLKNIGFYIHERPTRKALADYYTNTIYYGDSVEREDILIIAYQMLNAGFTLQAIEHSRFGDGWKSHSLELGVDTAMTSQPVLSLDTIKNIIENNPYLKTRQLEK